MFDMDEIIRENEYLKIENRKLRENKNELFTALSKAQGEFEVVTKNQKNPFFNSKYLTLAELINAIRKPLSENGLCVIQFPMVTKEDNSVYVTVKTIIAHTSGEKIENELTMPISTGQKISDSQAIGSGITYARRYALQSIVGISAHEDDDGNKACGKIVDQKAQQMKQQTKKNDTDKIKCATCGRELETKIVNYNGNKMSFAEYSKQVFGKPVCLACGLKAKDNIA